MPDSKEKRVRVCYWQIRTDETMERDSEGHRNCFCGAHPAFPMRAICWPSVCWLAATCELGSRIPRHPTTACLRTETVSRGTPGLPAPQFLQCLLRLVTIGKLKQNGYRLRESAVFFISASCRLRNSQLILEFHLLQTNSSTKS